MLCFGLSFGWRLDNIFLVARVSSNHVLSRAIMQSHPTWTLQTEGDRRKSRRSRSLDKTATWVRDQNEAQRGHVETQRSHVGAETCARRSVSAEGGRRRRSNQTQTEPVSRRSNQMQTEVRQVQCSHRVLLKSTCAFLCFFFTSFFFMCFFVLFFSLEVLFFLILGK